MWPGATPRIQRGLLQKVGSDIKELKLTGPMSAHLYVSTSRNDAFVTLHVSDVDPATGASNEITAGWDSLVFRELDTSRSVTVVDRTRRTGARPGRSGAAGVPPGG